MNWWLVIGATIGGLSWIPGLVVAFLGRGKKRADAAATLTKSAMELMEAVQNDMTDMSNELRASRREIQALRRHLSAVEELLRDNGIPAPEFVWPPPGNGVTH